MKTALVTAAKKMEKRSPVFKQHVKHHPKNKPEFAAEKKIKTGLKKNGAVICKQ